MDGGDVISPRISAYLPCAESKGTRKIVHTLKLVSQNCVLLNLASIFYRRMDTRLLTMHESTTLDNKRMELVVGIYAYSLFLSLLSVFSVFSRGMATEAELDSLQQR